MAKLFLKTFGLLLLFPVLYVLHRYLLLPLFPNVTIDFVNFSYLYNVCATLLMGAIIFLAAHYSKNYLGFIFLAFGFMKLGLFLLFSKSFGFTLDRSLFLHFFIPYLIGLGIEIFILTQQLKDFKPNKIK